MSSISQRATASRDQQREDRKPAFVVRALSVDGRGRQWWSNIGAAWHRRDGKEGFTVRLQALPLSGTLVLMPPLPDEELPEEPEDQQ